MTDLVRQLGMMLIYRCMVCDYETKIAPGFISEKDASIEEWNLHVVPFETMAVELLVCPKCSLLSVDEIFEGHKARIREGRDSRYH